MSENNYKDTLKATTIFSGVQIVLIVIAVAKSKVISLWLGPYGLGLLSLYNSVLSMIFSISNLGLSSSGVKEVATVLENRTKLTMIIITLKRWGLGTGILGALITIGLSPLLSHIAFKSNAETVSFIVLSIVILFNCLSYNNLAIIQGSQNIKTLALTNILGSSVGFLISLPCYYFLGANGILPSIIISSFILYIVTNKNLQKLNLVEKSIIIGYSKSWYLGKDAVKLGLMISLSFIAVTLTELIIKTFITRVSDVATVGLYQAGWTLNTTYLGMVFTAMATDFFPKLSMVASDQLSVRLKVNHQAEIALLILGPMIVIMIVFLPIITNILYTIEFVGILSMTRLLLLGSLLKAGSWAISFVFLAKGNGKLYLINELGVKVITIPVYLVLFYYYKLDGIGIAYVLDQSIYFIWVSVAAKIKYDFVYSREFFVELLIISTISLSAYLIQIFYLHNFNLIISIMLIIFVIMYSCLKLNSKIDFLSYIKSKI